MNNVTTPPPRCGQLWLRSLRPAAALALLVANVLLASSAGRAATLLDYTVSNPSQAHGPGTSVTYASRSKVGAQDVQITSIMFALDGRFPGSYDTTAYLFSDAGDRPGLLLASVRRFFAPGELTHQGLAFYEYALAAPVNLQAGAKYWAAIGTASAGYPVYIGYTDSLQPFVGYGVTPSLTHCTTLSYPPNGQWGVNAPTITLLYKLQGSVVPRLTATATGGGSVAISPPTLPYPLDPTATVTATPENGWSFLGWLGDGAGTNYSLTLAMTRNKFVHAVFGTTLSTPPLIIPAPKASLYPHGTAVRLTAIPPDGAYFGSWTGDTAGTENPKTILLTNQNPSVSCVFVPLALGEFALTLTENGKGVVHASPPAARYTSGEAVTITASPDPGQDFLGWSGSASGVANPLTVTMTASRVITANFTKRPALSVPAGLAGLSPDGFRVFLAGEFGGSYQVLGSTNLTDWLPLGAITSDWGTAQFTDTAGTNTPARFYRALEAQ